MSENDHKSLLWAHTLFTAQQISYSNIHQEHFTAFKVSNKYLM